MGKAYESRRRRFLRGEATELRGEPQDWPPTEETLQPLTAAPGFTTRYEQEGQMWVPVTTKVMPDPTLEEIEEETKALREAELAARMKQYGEDDEMLRLSTSYKQKPSPDLPFWTLSGRYGETQASQMSQLRGTDEYKRMYKGNLDYHLQRLADTGKLGPMFPQKTPWEYMQSETYPDAGRLAVYEAKQEAHRIKAERGL